MYVPVDRRSADAPQPVSSVVCHISERPRRVLNWLEGAFTLPKLTEEDKVMGVRGQSQERREHIPRAGTNRIVLFETRLVVSVSVSVVSASFKRPKYA
eukprot:7743829-Pyramimonas_sp.AAC.2